MILASLLLTLKLMSLSIKPEDPLKKDDQTLATCATEAMTKRPSTLVLTTSKDGADARFIVGNHTGVRIHVVGKLVKADGTVMIEVNHVTHGFNHGLCHQLDGLLDEMAKKLSEKPKR